MKATMKVLGLFMCTVLAVGTIAAWKYQQTSEQENAGHNVFSYSTHAWSGNLLIETTKESNEATLPKCESSDASLKFIYVDGKCYFSSGQPTDAYRAQHKCFENGGTLFEPHSLQEMSTVGNAFKSYLEMEASWIGINDLETEGRFVTNSNKTELNFLLWDVDQPDDNNYYGENCVRHTFASNFLDDISCFASLPAICEKAETAISPMPYSASLLPELECCPKMNLFTNNFIFCTFTQCSIIFDLIAWSKGLDGPMYYSEPYYMYRIDGVWSISEDPECPCAYSYQFEEECFTDIGWTGTNAFFEFDEVSFMQFTCLV